MGFFKDGEFGVGVGSFVLLLNATLLGAYTFGCHAFRHIIGGHDNTMSCGQNTAALPGVEGRHLAQRAPRSVRLRQPLLVGLTDVYVRLVSMGIIHDYNTWN